MPNKKKLLQEAQDELKESQKAFAWALETARRILRLKTPIDFSWCEAYNSEVEFRRQVYADYGLVYRLEYKYRVVILGKEFQVNNKEDRARISGFLDHYEMLEKAKKKK